MQRSFVLVGQCIASRMLSSSVVSPRQTLRELARDHE